MIKKLDPRVGWLVLVLGVVCVMPASKPPVDARQAMISDPNPKPILRSGAGAPSGATGNAGDWFVNSDAPVSLYGPKAAPTTWPGPVTLVGPAGANGTNATVEQSAIVSTTSAGTYTWTFPVAYGAGVVPIVEAVAQATVGSTNVINVQLDGAPTNTQAKFRVTVTNQSVVALLGLTILSVPASPGVNILHVTARAP